jgi:hypothetical protein
MVECTDIKVETEKEMIALGRWSKDDLERIMSKALCFSSPGERIGFISQHFLNTTYLECTLTGNIYEPEAFVINLEGVDCFTFIDYVEAMRLSGSFNEFKENLKKVRYQSGDVDYRKRNHFFTDWAEFSRANIRDVTGKIGGNTTKKAKKVLNIKEGGTCFLEGITPREREILYISADNMHSSVPAAMKTGDYAGIYSELPGLDVSHAGIIIKADNDKILLRHASSLEKYRKVIDQPLKEYMADKAGLIVLRALEPARRITI